MPAESDDACPGSLGACATAPVAAAPFDAAFFHHAVQQAGIGVVAVDPAGVIRHINPVAQRFFGGPEHVAVGQPLEVLAPPEYRSLLRRAVQRTLQQRSVNTFEYALVPPGGARPVHLAITLSCVIDDADHCQGVMGWLRDISQRKALESNLHRSRQMASLGTLASGMAHHFNNIICGMSAMVDLAQQTDDPVTVYQALRMSAEAAARIGYITRSLLAFSEPDCVPQVSVNSHHLIQTLANVMAEPLAKKGITLQCDLQAKKIASVPEKRFNQVLQHLLQNAEESFASLPLDHPRTITIRTLSQDDQMMLQFADTGCGIPLELQSMVFTPFFTTKGVQSGGNHNNPGLGLALVHGVVMDLNGHAWVDSVPGKGTTIHILLPAV